MKVNAFYSAIFSFICSAVRHQKGFFPVLFLYSSLSDARSPSSFVSALSSVFASFFVLACHSAVSNHFSVISFIRASSSVVNSPM